MAIWLQPDWQGQAEPAVAKRVGLLLLGHEDAEELRPLLLRPVPAVDGLIAPRSFPFKRQGLPIARVRTPPAVTDLVAGRFTPEVAAYDSLLWLRPGEQLLAGGQYNLLRETAQLDLGTRLLPVHYPVGLGLTLITLEPRWIATRSGPDAAPALLDLPIESHGLPPAEPPSPRVELGWVLLERAVRALLAGERRAGYRLLEQLFAQTLDRAPGLAGLAVRNGMAAALAGGDGPLLDRWLERALLCRSSGEVLFMRALVPLVERDLQRAEQGITRLLESSHLEEARWVSGGGELSYRALTLRGRLRAQQGDLNRALTDWMGALQQNIDYLEPLRLATEHRFHPTVLDRAGLREFARGRSATCAALVARLYAQSESPVRPDDGESKAGPSIRWEGPWFTQSSLARVNRELAARLLAAGWDLSAIPTEPQGYHPPGSDSFRPLSERLWHPHGRAAVTIRHCWPPSLEPVAEGKLVIILPWEFGALPERWLVELKAADQVWVYSEWVRQGAIRSGLLPERVAVVPCGIDPECFYPAPQPAENYGPFRFLYVGGTIARKGYDLALQAFLEEFHPDEPVLLIIKDFGSDTFYQGINGRKALRRAEAATAGLSRRVTVIDQTLTDAELRALYRSADCLVAPYRAEGFCMPALEAMACATPAILPHFGPALDYARPETALLVEAAPVSVGRELNGMVLAGEGLYCEIPLPVLRQTMRHAYSDRASLAAMGRLAATAVHADHTWAHAAAIAARHLHALCESRTP